MYNIINILADLLKEEIKIKIIWRDKIDIVKFLAISIFVLIKAFIVNFITNFPTNFPNNNIKFIN